MGHYLSQYDRIDEEKHQTSNPNKGESVPARKLQKIRWNQPQSLNAKKHLSSERQKPRKIHEGPVKCSPVPQTTTAEGRSLVSR